MKKAKAKLMKLLATGKIFTYENFSTKGPRGYPDAVSPEWVAWVARIEGIISKIVGEDSAAARQLTAGSNVLLVGYGEDSFQQAKSCFLGALQVTIDILDDDIFDEIKSAEASAPREYSNKVFIVHGHDDQSKADLEIMLTEMGFEPVVLHREADEGQTIIEKFEKHADVGYAFIILTPDEVAYLAAQESKPDAERAKELRARPNVIFEFGYFVGRLGRPRVCCLYNGDVVLPSDLDGLVYKKFNKSVEEVGYSISKELKAQGYRF